MGWKHFNCHRDFDSRNIKLCLCNRIVIIHYQKQCIQYLIHTLQIVGFILLLISIITNGFQFVYEEKLFKKYHIEPFFMVGVEGITCVITFSIFILIFSFIPCSFGVEACVFNDDSQPFLQRPDVYFRQIGQNPLLLGIVILYVLSVYFYNISGLYITKCINALARALCDVSRTILIWGVGIIVTQSIGIQSINYRWQMTQWQPILIQLIGFLFILFGNLIYNQIITIAWLNAQKYDQLVQSVQQPENKDV